MSVWRSAPELGTVLGIRFVLALAQVAGRRAAGVFLRLLARYYVLMSPRVRRSSRTYLDRMGLPSSTSAIVDHVATFARVALDRFFFLRGDLDQFVIERTGNHHIEGVAKTKSGALLLGSHVGSFEAMRAVARDNRVPLSVIVDSRSAERLNRILREIATDAQIGVIAIDPEGLQTVLEVRACIERGELVAILGDRAVDREGRNVEVDFLGGRADLPAGPYVLAHALKCPVFVVFGLFEEPNRYSLHCEPFADEVHLDRARRKEALAEYAQRYADRLEVYARKAPYNWFNFFDFWK